jgi:hypothetical protein
MADVQIAVDSQQDVQVALSTISETQIVASLPTFQGPVAGSIDDLSDVDTSGIVAGQILQWDGSKWVATWGSREIQATFEAREYAQAYFAAVETADGQALEAGVKEAIVNFIKGCKIDNTWNAIKACCILAGARTLNGALVPLAGTAPTNNNFVSGDYSRTTGLVGDGSTKYLDSNRAENADPQDSHHMSFYVTEVATSGSFPMLGESSVAASTSLTGIYFYLSSPPYKYNLRSRNIGGVSERLGDANTKFVAINRSSSTQFTARADTSTATFNVASTTPKSDTYYIYSRNAGAIDNPGNQRMAFYSIGESLDLALLDSRVTQLMADLTAAIP